MYWKGVCVSHVSYSLRPQGLSVASQTPLSMEFSRQEYWSGLPFPSPEDLWDPDIKPRTPACRQILYLHHVSHQGSPIEKVVVVQSLSRVQVFATPWPAARQASLSFTIPRSLLKLMSIESVMPSDHLILCHPHLLLPSIFPRIRVFLSVRVSIRDRTCSSALQANSFTVWATRELRLKR